jgi:hypothetical protein
MSDDEEIQNTRTSGQDQGRQGQTRCAMPIPGHGYSVKDHDDARTVLTRPQ